MFGLGQSKVVARTSLLHLPRTGSHQDQDVAGFVLCLFFALDSWLSSVRERTSVHRSVYQQQFDAPGNRLSACRCPRKALEQLAKKAYLQRADPDLRHLDDDLAAPHGEGPRPGDARVLFMDPAAVRDAVRPSPFPLPLPSPPVPSSPRLSSSTMDAVPVPSPSNPSRPVK